MDSCNGNGSGYIRRREVVKRKHDYKISLNICKDSEVWKMSNEKAVCNEKF